jgi:hypothetical protein
MRGPKSRHEQIKRRAKKPPRLGSLEAVGLACEAFLRKRNLIRKK